VKDTHNKNIIMSNELAIIFLLLPIDTKKGVKRQIFTPFAFNYLSLIYQYLPSRQWQLTSHPSELQLLD
jgi:hypothetical protein